MTATERKKQELLSFMKWKMSHGSETEEEVKEIMQKCRKMSYKALREYAIRNDLGVGKNATDIQPLL